MKFECFCVCYVWAWMTPLTQLLVFSPGQSCMSSISLRLLCTQLLKNKEEWYIKAWSMAASVLTQKQKTAKFSSKANNYSILYLLKFPAIWCLFRSLQKLNSCNSVSFLSNWRLNYLRNNQTLKRRSHFWRVWGRILATLRVYSMCCRTSRTSGRWRVSQSTWNWATLVPLTVWQSTSELAMLLFQ